MADGPPADWPHAETSRIVACRPHRWHVQQVGTGPELVLLHGAGGSTHSWRGLVDAMQDRFRLIAIDLPGQGFSRMGTRLRCGIQPMSEDIAALARQEGWQPRAVVGHSAGAALALTLAPIWDCPAVSINGALEPFSGVAGWLFPFLARLLALNPFASAALAQTAALNGVQGLRSVAGGSLGREGAALYARLIADRRHIDGTLAMMAQWDLAPLVAALPRLRLPVLLIAGMDDRTVPPDTSERAAAQLADATLRRVPGRGHLVHEVEASTVARQICAFLETRPAP